MGSGVATVSSAQSSVHPAQALLLKVGILGHVMPLLFGYDVTHDDGDEAAAMDLDARASQRGPGFLGLSIERSNMQVPQGCRGQHNMWCFHHLTLMRGMTPQTPSVCCLGGPQSLQKSVPRPS